MLATPGKSWCNNAYAHQCCHYITNETNIVSRPQPEVIPASSVLIGMHIDSLLTERIKMGQYVAFAHLLPRDKQAPSDKQKLELISKGGTHLLCSI